MGGGCSGQRSVAVHESTTKMMAKSVSITAQKASADKTLSASSIAFDLTRAVKAKKEIADENKAFEESVTDINMTKQTKLSPEEYFIWCLHLLGTSKYGRLLRSTILTSLARYSPGGS